MRTYSRKRPNHQLIENVHELCRLCLSKREAVAEIFPDDTNNVCAVLALRIMICVGLEMKRDECLPNMICAECLNNLDKYYAFRKKCEVSYQKLKSHVLAVKEKQYQLKLEQENEAKKLKAIESDDEMKLVVTFEKDQLSEVNVLNLNGVATANNFNDQKLSDLGKVNSIESNTENKDMIQESEEQVQGLSPDSPGPDIATFLSTMLLQLGILTHHDSGLVFSEQSISTLALETGDGSQVTLELVEEDDVELVRGEKEVIDHSVDNVEDPNRENQSNAVNYVESNKISPKATVPKKKSTAAESKRIGAWCNECSKAFASKSALNRHRRIHSGEKPFPCPHCGRGFTQREVMMRHKLVHEERRPYVCTLCSKSFTQRGALHAHVRAHAPPQARPLTIHRCSRCPKVFLYASGLSRHMMMHLGRIYVCGACERQFKDKSSLMRHLKNTNHTAADETAT